MRYIKFVYLIFLLFVSSYVVASSLEGVIVEDVKTIIRNEYGKIRSAEGKDIILVLGNTTAGKSTIINNQLGCNFAKVRDGMQRLAKPRIPVGDDYKYARMGEGLESCTLYPQVYAKEGFPFDYCDCPGFLDDRGETARIVTAISTQLAMRKSRSIRAIMAIIDANSFNVEAAKGFKSLGTTLGKMFYEDLEQLRSLPILFVVNKGEDFEPDDVITSVTKVMEKGREILDGRTGFFASLAGIVSGRPDLTPEQTENLENIKAMLKILTLMNPRNVIVANIFDVTGTKRSEIEATLSGIMAEKPAVDPRSLPFRVNDSVRVKFDMCMISMIKDDIHLFKKTRKLLQKIEILQVRIGNNWGNSMLDKKKLCENMDKVKKLDKDCMFLIDRNGNSEITYDISKNLDLSSDLKPLILEFQETYRVVTSRLLSDIYKLVTFLPLQVAELDSRDASELFFPDMSGKTILHTVAQSHNLEIFGYFIKRIKKYYDKWHEAFLIRNNDGDTVLHFAVMAGNILFLQAILDEGFPWWIFSYLRGYNGNTLVHTAAIKNLSILKDLVRFYPRYEDNTFNFDVINDKGYKVRKFG